MKILPLKKYPENILLQRCKKIDKISYEDLNLLDQMAATMYASHGVGLAAPQIGVDRQLAVIDIGNGLVKMINPVIIKKTGSDTMEEGCLSLPSGFQAKIKRAKELSVKYLNERGETISIKTSGLFSRAIQHEVDHLMGILIIDRMNPLKKMILKNKLRFSK